MTKATPITESKPLVKAYARGLHVAPRKMRLVTNLVKNMNVNDALAQLAYTEKKASPMVMKLLQSAVANATNNFSLDADHLYIKNITTDQAAVMKRYFPRARGSAFVIRRKLCNVNVVLEERKKGKAASSRMSFLKRSSSAKASEDKKPEIESVDAKEASNTKPEKVLGRKSEITKTDEQTKMNKVQNKRRLFNRKTGE
jgi:large subunit ribosomal protein L22